MTKVTQETQLTVETVKEWVSSLAGSQGFYGRLEENLCQNDKWEELTFILNDNNCKDIVDMVMIVEG